MKTWQRSLALFLVLFFVFYIYLVFISYSYNFDGVVFSHFLRYALVENDVTSILAPHHLLYLPFAFVSFKALSALFGYAMLEYFHLQLISLAFALASLLVIYKIFASLKIDDFYKLAGIAAVAFSFLFWFLAVEAEVHMPGFFFMVSGLYFLFFKELRPRDIVMSALLLSLSAGFHLSSGLILVGAALFFIAGKTAIKRVAQFYSLYGLFLALPYLWLTLVSRIDLLAWARDTLVGRSAFTGYTYSGTRFSRWRALSFDSLTDSLGSVKESILKAESPVLSILSLATAIVLVTVIGFYLVKAAERTKPLCFVYWMLPFFIFFTLWQPGNWEFKLNAAVPLLMLFVLSLSRLKGQRIIKPLFAAFCVLLFVVNFYTSIKPMHDIGNNENYLKAQAIKEKTEAKSTIVIAGTGKGAFLHGKIYIPYFALRETIILDWRLGKGFSFEQIAAEIAAKINRGEAVYFLSEVSAPSETVQDILDFHRRDAAEFNQFLQIITFSDKIVLDRQHYLLRVKKIAFGGPANR